MVKSPPARDVRDASLMPGLGRPLGEGHGKPFQYSCLENPMERGAWWATVQFSSVFSHVGLFVTPWTAACQASLSITNSWSLLKLMSSDAIQSIGLQRVEHD